MNAWSEYLRAQAEIADRMAGTMTTPESRKEFTEIAGSFRRDADIEDETPSLPRLTMPPKLSYPPASCGPSDWRPNLR
jgi:hypothetical protein